MDPGSLHRFRDSRANRNSDPAHRSMWDVLLLCAPRQGADDSREDYRNDLPDRQRRPRLQQFVCGHDNEVSLISILFRERKAG